MPVKLYVGNVPFQASEEDLSDWFTKAGFTVDNIDLVRDRYTDQSRGFGFVEIRNDEMDRFVSQRQVQAEKQPAS